jgi:biotin operon repressor
MSIEVVKQAMTTPLPPGQRFVLVCLATHLDFKRPDKGAYPSMALIAKETGISRRSVVSHIQYLQDHGYIRVKRGRDENGRKAVNHYYLTLGATTAHGSTNGSATIAPSPSAIHVQPLHIGSAAIALKQTVNKKLKQTEEKVNQKEYPIWFRTLLEVDTIKGETPVSEIDFDKANEWATEKSMPNEALESAANYIDSNWRGGLKKRVKVLATFYNAAIKEQKWSTNSNGFNGSRVSQTNTNNAAARPIGAPSPLL